MVLLCGDHTSQETEHLFRSASVSWAALRQSYRPHVTSAGHFNCGFMSRTHRSLRKSPPAMLLNSTSHIMRSASCSLCSSAVFPQMKNKEIAKKLFLFTSTFFGFLYLQNKIHYSYQKCLLYKLDLYKVDKAGHILCFLIRASCEI